MPVEVAKVESDIACLAIVIIHGEHQTVNHEHARDSLDFSIWTRVIHELIMLWERFVCQMRGQLVEFARDIKLRYKCTLLTH